MLREVEQALDVAEQAQQPWSNKVVRQRLKSIGQVATKIAEEYPALIAAVNRPNSTPAEIMASEVMPLADACRFTARAGRQVLAPKSQSWLRGAWWMGRINVSTIREPWGIILVIAPSNYPLFIPGVQIIQALAAGNAVLVKPAPGCNKVLEVLRDMLVACNIPEALVQILPTEIEVGQEVIKQGVDKVILTGSVHTGRSVLRHLSEKPTAATMELSGCDSVFISPKADLERAAKCVAYSLRLNGGATCIAPRRILVVREAREAFEEALLKELQSATAGRANDQPYEVSSHAANSARRVTEQAISQGARILYGELPEEQAARSTSVLMHPIVLGDIQPRMEVARSDIFAPLTSVLTADDMSAAINIDRLCPYSLCSSVFAPRAYAEMWAQEIEAGCVVINDIIVPTADPRVSFGGRDQSGWGVTRGSDGLLEMTRPKTICTRHGNWLPHLDGENSQDVDLLAELLKFFHGGSLGASYDALKGIITKVRSRKPSEDSTAIEKQVSTDETGPSNSEAGDATTPEQSAPPETRQDKTEE